MNMVTFYALQPDRDPVTVVVHWVEPGIIGTYTDDPRSTLLAIRKIADGSRVDGFRVEDSEGRVLLDHLDREDGSAA